MRHVCLAVALAAAALIAGLLGAWPAAAGPAQPQSPQSPQSPQWAQVSAGGEDTCAVQTNRTLWCWGSDRHGVLGDYRTDGNVPAPQRVGLRAGWVQVAVGMNHACAVRNDHSLWCWGSGADGELGIGTTAQHDHPMQVAGGDGYAFVTGAGGYDCAIRVDGTLWCWGSNSNGNLGNGDEVDQLSPVQVGTATDWTLVSAGPAIACGAQADGSGWCWGNGINGQLGNGQYGAGTHSDVPLQLPGGDVWASVSPGGGATCGIEDSGTLWCWGSNFWGEMGNGTTQAFPDQTTPIQVGVRTGWVQVGSGNQYVCALHGEPTLWCWGNGVSGELGTGRASGDQTVPARVGSSPNWVQVSVGFASTCGIQRGHTLWCWGDNSYGEAGTGSFASPLTTPQQVF